MVRDVPAAGDGGNVMLAQGFDQMRHFDILLVAVPKLPVWVCGCVQRECRRL